jgi:putative sterol carrier protein
LKTPKDPNAPGPHLAKSCRELLQMMPKGFSPSAANGLTAVYQFEVSGTESFTAHLRIEGQTCTYADGPAERPDVVIKTPADVWLAISKGEMNGQLAFLTRKFKVEGNPGLLLKLPDLFPR